MKIQTSCNYSLFVDNAWINEMQTRPKSFTMNDFIVLIVDFYYSLKLNILNKRRIYSLKNDFLGCTRSIYTIYYAFLGCKRSNYILFYNFLGCKQSIYTLYYNFLGCKQSIYTLYYSFKGCKQSIYTLYYDFLGCKQSIYTLYYSFVECKQSIYTLYFDYSGCKQSIYTLINGFILSKRKNKQKQIEFYPLNTSLIGYQSSNISQICSLLHKEAEHYLNERTFINID